jgi:DNA-binding GntR family transcriptional regulator
MQSNSLKEKAYSYIRHNIIIDHFKANHPLNEKELSEQLGISKTPVREAIQLLHKEGFVQFIPKKGAFVATVTLTDLREIMQIRLALEPMAAGLASLNHDSVTLSEFETEFRRLTKKPTKDYPTMSEVGKHFHKFLFDCTRNQRLVNILDNLNRQMDRIRTIFCLLVPPVYNDNAVNEHLSIIEAINNGDRKAAEDIMREHISNYFEALKNMV